MRRYRLRKLLGPVQPRRPAPVYDPRCRQITRYSRALGIHKSFYIYIPPDLPSGARVPALYLLRGHEREWINPHEDVSRGGQNVIDTYERLRAAGQVGALIMVFPGLSSDNNQVPGLLVNMRAPQRARGAAGLGRGRFADYFFDELLPYVDAQFPTIASGRRRGIAGFSLGGAMALAAAARRPELFATAAAYDGTFLYASADGRQIQPSDPVLGNALFDPAYGVPRDMRRVLESSATNLVLRGSLPALRAVTWMVGYGPEAQEPWQANFYRGEHMLQCLRARGLRNALPSAVMPEGVHSWRTADTFMAQTLPLHSQALRAPS